MPLFEYDAVNPDHFSAIRGLRLRPGHIESFVDDFAHTISISSGVVEALSPEEAVTKLNQQNLVPVRLNLVVNNKDGMIQLMRLRNKRNHLMGVQSPTSILTVPTVQRHKRARIAIIAGSVGLALIAAAIWLLRQ